MFLWFVNYEYVRRKWSLKSFNPLLLLVVIYIPTVVAPLYIGPLVLIDGGYFNPYFQFAVLMTNLSLVCSFFLEVIFFNFLLKIKGVEWFFLRVYSKNITRKKINIIEFMFFFMAISLFFFMAESSFGVINWIMDPRSGYQYYRDGFGAIYALSLSCLSVAYTVCFLGRKSNSAFICKSFFYIAIVYFWGSKGFILSFGLFCIICLQIAEFRYLKAFSVILFPVLSAVIIYNLFSALGDVGYLEALSYFDHYKNSADYFKAFLNSDINLFFGQVMLSDLWAMVPRAVYPEKPYVYGISLVNEVFFPGMTELGQTPAYGGPVKEFSDFGFFSVVFFSIFNIGFLCKLYILNFYFKVASHKDMRFDNKPLNMIVFSLCFSPMFLAYIPTIPSIVVVIFIWIVYGTFARCKLY
ncbi:hypothetical protein ACE1V3_04360 [Aeromonas veronii bv. sobria]|uniref:hypothetical protein n=1 Tax=Aeromonas veronii TaxID=654 RepID=UPI0035C25B9A